jgi:sialate O-acetylesterase
MFSAVGYHFGRELAGELEVPVGLIQCAWGGTPAEAWTTAARLAADAALAPSRDRELKPPVAQARLYNGMVAPLERYGVAGVIWYQGESNVDQAAQYRLLFPAMIESWREARGREDLPFLFVQLAAFLARQDEPGDSAWAELRESQAAALALPHTGMAVAIDVGDAEDIHPKNKREVGRRLALLALRDVYGRDLHAEGPTFAGLELEGPRVRVRFDQAEGLMAAGGLVRGFALAGDDGVFHRAEGRIEGDSVVLTSPEVPAPTAVRYAWADNPEATLTSGAGLPAVPFRTDGPYASRAVPEGPGAPGAPDAPDAPGGPDRR